MESLRCVKRTRIFQIVLFVGVYFVLQTNTAEECSINPKPCKCSRGILMCSSLEELAALYKQVGNNIIPWISFSGGNITSISGNSLPPGLENLYFTNQPLTNISDDAFNGSAQTLHSLTIIGAKFRQLPKALFVLTNLTYLQIQNTPLWDWKDSVLEHILPSVEELDLQNDNLTAWPGWISSCHSLASLYISYNPLKSIPDDAFWSVNHTLKELVLSQTGLTKVPMALSSLTNLTSLDLSGNALTNIHDIEQLTSMPFGDHLQNLILSSSQLMTIPNFSSLTSLVQMLLNNNNISDATSGSFPQSLTHLYLRQNQLPSVPTSIANLSRLSELYLSYNQITSIEPGSLPPSLTRLDLSYNSISVITNTSLTNMENLTYLSLYTNPISEIDPLAFSDLVSLTYLSLDLSSLREIPLAFALLPADIDLNILQYGPIRCPCPPHQELVDWFALTNGTASLVMSCDSYQPVEQYLTIGCVSTSTLTTVAVKETTQPGGATALQGSLFSLRVCILAFSVFLLFPY